MANKLSMIVITMLVINVFSASFAGVLGVTNIGDLVINGLFNEDTIDSTNPEINPELDQGVQKELNPDAEETNVTFLEGLKIVFGFIINLLTLGFAFLNMLIQTGAPHIIIMVLGLPVTMGYHLAIVSAIRGFSI